MPSDEPSHVIKATKPDALAGQTVRFSLARSNTAEQIAHTVSAVQRAADSLRW